MKTQNKTLLLGYRHPSIKLYKTRIKPLGYIVAGLGVLCLTVAIIPNGLGIIFYPMGFGLLGFVGVDVFKFKKKIKDKIRYLRWKY